MARLSLLIAAALAAGCVALDPWQDWTLPIEQRLDDLMGRLNITDQVYQTWSIAPALSNLGIKDYNWRSNCVHGWAASGGTWLPNETWTVFPAPLGLGSSFDRQLVRAVNTVTSTEGRALHNLGLLQHNGSSTEARGLDCFAPNLNVLRDARWGRNQEVLSEDPYALSQLGLAFIQGLQQGEAPQYLKVAGCAKHYAVHDGPESDPVSREVMIANVSLRDAFDAYLPQFRTAIQEGNVAQLMCAYSSTNYSGYAPDCASTWLLDTVARKTFNFTGMVISDNGAIEMVWQTHKWLSNATEAAAACLNAGCDNDLGHDAQYVQGLPQALQLGLTSAANITRAARRNMRLRMMLGEFDPDYLVPYKQLGAESLDTPAHQALNLQAALEGLVLLTNDGTLPLAPGARIAVVGPTMNDSNTLLGNYQGIPSRIWTVAQGIAQVSGSSAFPTATGCPDGQQCPNTTQFGDALTAAAGADVIIAAVGLNQAVAHEGSDWTPASSGSCNGVPTPVGQLPGCQLQLLQALKAAYPTKKLVVVTITGNPVIQSWELANASALITTAYPGAMGGLAIAQALYGQFSFGARLPYTVPADVASLPSLADVAFAAPPGRTYRYSTLPYSLPFGYGRSYTTFAYSNLQLSTGTVAPCSSLNVTVTVTNTGSMDGDEVVQVYLAYPSGAPWSLITPMLSLRQFTRVTLPAGVATTVTLPLDNDAFSVVDEQGFRQLLPGTFTLYAGGQQPGQSGGQSCGQAPLSTTFTVTGSSPTPYVSCPGGGQ